MKKSIEISTLSITIKTLTLDGKRFTKSVFNQLQERPLFQKVSGEWREYGRIIGFVNIPEDEYRWLILEKDGHIYKSLGKPHRENFYGDKYMVSESYICDGVDFSSSEEDKKYDIVAYHRICNIHDSYQLFISI